MRLPERGLKLSSEPRFFQSLMTKEGASASKLAMKFGRQTSWCLQQAHKGKRHVFSAQNATLTNLSGLRFGPTQKLRVHSDAHIEACLTLKDENGTAVPGYGWLFPAGDGTVNIGCGALSTMKVSNRLISINCVMHIEIKWLIAGILGLT